MKAAFKGAYVIQLNADVWSGKLERTGFFTSSIAIFYEIDDNRRAIGRKIGGDAWGDNIPENIAPRSTNSFTPLEVTTIKSSRSKRRIICLRRRLRFTLAGPVANAGPPLSLPQREERLRRMGSRVEV